MSWQPLSLDATPHHLATLLPGKAANAAALRNIVSGGQSGKALAQYILKYPPKNIVVQEYSVHSERHWAESHTGGEGLPRRRANTKQSCRLSPLRSLAQVNSFLQ